MNLTKQRKLREEIWFVNAGILSNKLYTMALNSIMTDKIDPQNLDAIFFLAIDYLIQYFEFASINSTPLVNECIKRHLQFVEKFITVHSLGNRYLPTKYWDIMYATFDKFSNVEDLIEKQFSIDALERICNFLSTRSFFWIKLSDSFAFLKTFGRQMKHSVIYNSFLIPKFHEYQEPLTHPGQKIFEKIEYECNCRIFLDVNSADCRIGESNMVLEVLFDWYKGNFLGFLDCLTYVVKILNPKKHFIKSLRTITRNEDMYYSILSDLPIKELRAVEKVCRTGELIGPFLSDSVTSKKVFALLQSDRKSIHEEAIDRFLAENEDLEFWKATLSPPEFQVYTASAKTYISDHKGWLLQCKAWTEYKSTVVQTARKYSLENLKDEQSVGKESIDSEEQLNQMNDNENTENFNENNAVIGKNHKKRQIDTANFSNSEKIPRVPKLSIIDLRISYDTAKKDKLDDHFETLYDRITKTADTPNECLNHTLRVIIRCKTHYNMEDYEIAKLGMPPLTIHQLLKKYYNFDLKAQTFITREQRKASFLKKQSIIRREKEELERQERERMLYLEKRQKMMEELERQAELARQVIVKEPTPDTTTSESKVESIEEIPENYEDVVVDDDILFADFREKKEELSPEFRKAIFAVFGELNGDLLQLFNEKRINSLDLWHNEIKDNLEAYKDFFPQKHKPITCDATASFQRQINQDQVNLIHSSVNTNIFIFLKLLSRHDPLLDKEFPKAIKGESITIDFLTNLNKVSANNPKFLSLVDPRDESFKKRLNYNLCVISFDIFLICISLNSALGMVFEEHLKNLLVVVEKSNHNIKNLFKLFEFDDRLEDAKSVFKLRMHNRTKDEIGIFVRLSQDIRRLSEMIFRSPCCNWRQEKCIRILYVSLNIDGNKKCQEPFARKGGDRRLKKIETKSNCIITMKIITHPTTLVQIPFVEIFYDFFKGNHFCCMDMLKKMFAESRGSTARLINFKHLICLPYGELWVIPDLEWLRTKASFMLAQEI